MGGDQGGNHLPDIAVIPEIKLESNKSIEIKGGEAIVKGEVSNTESDTVLIKAENSKIESSANIELSGDNSVAFEAVNSEIKSSGELVLSGDNSIGIKLEDSILEMTGTIELAGDVAIGIHAVKSEESKPLSGDRTEFDVAIDGTIIVNGKESIGVYGENVAVLNRGIIESNGTGSGNEVGAEIERGSIGILISGNSGYAENQGSILVKNDQSYGMKVESGAEAINRGDILLESNLWDETVWHSEDYATHKQYGILMGIYADGNGKISNEGQIILDGQGFAMAATNSSTAVNNGEIELITKKITETYLGDEYPIEGEEYSFAHGILAVDGSIGINGENGKISGSGSTYGIWTIDSTGINRGQIVLEALEREQTSNGETTTVYSHPTGMDGSNSTLINDTTGSIIVSNYGFGMYGIEGSEIINRGKIEAEGDGVYGIYADESSVLNSGTINILGVGAVGISAIGSTVKNNGTINMLINGTIDKYGNDTIGIKATGSTIIENNGNIILNGTDALGSPYLIGIYTEWYDGTITNNGTIEINSAYAARGIDSGGGDIINNGIINIVSNSDWDSNAIRIQGSGEAINNGTLNLSGTGINGIYAANGATATNFGEINVYGTGINGVYALGTWSSAVITNEGIINVVGTDSYGMYAHGGRVINGENGTINVGADAAGGMYASSLGSAINYGTINIESGNLSAGLTTTDNKGNVISIAGMKAEDGGVIENYGTINADASLEIKSNNGGAYVIGTTEDGNYGKITAKIVSIDGDVKVSSNITKNGFKDEYTIQNVINAEEITYGDNFNFLSTSLLYDAEAITDRWGNLDGKLSRNDKTISDFTAGYLKSAADILGKYHNEANFASLSADAKTVVKSIDTESVEGIARTLEALTPTIYSNLGREIFRIGKVFDKYTIQTIENLDGYRFNFSMIGETSKMDSRNSIEGYEANRGGFIGAMDFGSGYYGTLGYLYSGIDYDGSSKGNIQSIQLGINKLGKISEFDYGLGLSGEYNFHENDRKISTLNRTADSDFNSYRIGLKGELSKDYGLGKGYTLTPFTSLEFIYAAYESFTESGAGAANAELKGENYTAVEPKVGAKLEKEFNDSFKVYVAADYSYDFGNMDISQKYSFEGFEGSAHLPKDDMENGTTKIQIGADYNIKQFNFNINAGKEYNRRDNSFIGARIGYKF